MVDKPPQYALLTINLIVKILIFNIKRVLVSQLAVGTELCL